jgi:tRNA G18 (ribose-2'-O)-methylase SpoU
MPVREITGFSNPLVKQVRSLRDKKHRRVEGRFLAEGLRILTEALDAGVAPEMLWRTPDSADHPLVKKLEGSVHFHDLAHILFDQALLAEGGMPDDPAAYVKRVNALLT